MKRVVCYALCVPVMVAFVIAAVTLRLSEKALDRLEVWTK